MPVINRNFKSSFFLILFLLSAAVALLSSCQDSRADNQSAPRPMVASPNLPTSATTPATEENHPLIVALGDSLTAGYGLETAQAWPSLLQQRLDRQGLNYRVVNKGVSGDTSKGGLSRMEEALRGDVRILILELGANDGLRGQPPAELKKNLSGIIEAAQRRNIKVILAGMEAPPNFGDDYTGEFRRVYRDLAKEYKVALIPFFLSGVGGIADLNLPDGVHPNAKGSEIVLENVWQALEPMLR
jgi:acyl-CoA thioesterase-1